MRAQRFLLKAFAVLIGCVSMLHLALGPHADGLLGIEMASSVARDAGLSSQNRFFGVSYALYAVVFWLASLDLSRYRPVLLAALGLTFVAGLARVVSWLALGAPPAPVVLLLLVELLGPALLWALLRRPAVRPDVSPDRRTPPKRSSRR